MAVRTAQSDLERLLPIAVSGTVLFSAPHPMTTVLVEPGGGKLSRVPVGQTEFAHRGHLCNLTAMAIWNDPAQDEQAITWTRDLWKGWSPWAAQAVYLNYMDADEAARPGPEAYGAETFARSQEVKAQVDPGNLFTHNMNLIT